MAGADAVRGAQLDADEKSRRELGWKAAQENRLAWQEKLSNQQHERNRAVETKLVEQMRKNNSDLATNSLLEARMRAPPCPVMPFIQGMGSRDQTKTMQYIHQHGGIIGAGLAVTAHSAAVPHAVRSVSGPEAGTAHELPDQEAQARQVMLGNAHGINQWGACC